MKISKFLRESPIFSVMQAQQRFDSGIEELLESESLNLFQAWVLLAIYLERPEPASPSQLAAIFGAKRSNMSHIVSRLEARRLIRRQLNPHDSRSYALQLRQDGLKIAHRLVRVFDRTQSAFEKQVGTLRLKQAIETLGGLSVDRRT